MVTKLHRPSTSVDFKLLKYIKCITQSSKTMPKKSQIYACELIARVNLLGPDPKMMVAAQTTKSCDVLFDNPWMMPASKLNTAIVPASLWDGCTAKVLPPTEHVQESKYEELNDLFKSVFSVSQSLSMRRSYDSNTGMITKPARRNAITGLPRAKNCTTLSSINCNKTKWYLCMCCDFKKRGRGVGTRW